PVESVSVADMSGRIRPLNNSTRAIGPVLHAIDVRELIPGPYVLIVRDHGERVFRSRFVVVR
ncbi:MAG: hypothetical protein KDB88_03700, partial [Flavobacteriales bacterium]|nr:hypothetical protein [Flavobacteriales bacterium]